MCVCGCVFVWVCVVCVHVMICESLRQMEVVGKSGCGRMTKLVDICVCVSVCMCVCMCGCVHVMICVSSRQMEVAGERG